MAYFPFWWSSSRRPQYEIAGDNNAPTLPVIFNTERDLQENRRRRKRRQCRQLPCTLLFLVIIAYFIWIHNNVDLKVEKVRFYPTRVQTIAAVPESVRSDDDEWKPGNLWDWIPPIFDQKEEHVIITNVTTLLPRAKADISVEALYDKLEFPKSSFYKEDEDVYRVDKSRWTKENKLKIFIVLHSHNDAGWTSTFQKYYDEKTKAILDNVLNQLTADPNKKFVWCETSFFSLWWKNLTMENRSKFKRLIERKQLEFIGGGWVMPDEATVHYVSHMTQLFEGHQWLQQNLGYKPKNGWAIDPFGLSPSIHYFHRKSGMENTVITRVHHALKRFLRQEKMHKFNWRQQWDRTGSADIFTYVMPNMYDKRESCGGPNLPYGVCTPYESSHDNWTKPSRDFLDQLRKKAMLFHTNNVLLPIGGDFQWSASWEWDHDVKNLEKIISIINSDEHYAAEMRFATLDEYFQAVHSDIQKGVLKPKSLTGDFFAYSDGDEDYWTGFYTSRPFYKSAERQLMSLMRAAQLAFTLTTAEILKNTESVQYGTLNTLLEHIIDSRRDLSLFQHHDGISGTSVNHVMVDYGKRMLTALQKCHYVLQQCFYFLNEKGQVDSIAKENATLKNTAHWFYEPVIYKQNYSSIWEDKVYTLNESHMEDIITIFNPLEYERHELVSLVVSTAAVKVQSMSGEKVASEIYPLFSNISLKTNDKAFLPNQSTAEISQLYVHADKFELNMLVHLKPLEIKNYKVLFDHTQSGRNTVKFIAYNTKVIGRKRLKETFSITEVEPHTRSNEDFQIYNPFMTISLNNKSGMVDEVMLHDLNRKFQLGFYQYKATIKSGFYLFNPEGPAKPIEFQEPWIIITEGSLKSYAEVWYPTVRHRVTLQNSDEFHRSVIHVENTIDIRSQQHYELSMRLQTDINTDGTFYTDSNGFQMMRRKYRSKLPLKGNVYPVASSTYIEDPSLRVTIVTGQPGGATSLEPGELEIIQDRRLDYDDLKGAGAGPTDNLVTVSSYKIILEEPNVNSAPAEGTVPVLSLAGHHHLLSLLHPLQVFRKNPTKTNVHSEGMKGYSGPVKKALACDVHLAGALSFLPETNNDNAANNTGDVPRQAALVFHRMGFDPRFNSSSMEEHCNLDDFGHLNVADIFGDLVAADMKSMSVTFTQERDTYKTNSSLALDPFQIYAFRVDYSGYTESSNISMAS